MLKRPTLLRLLHMLRDAAYLCIAAAGILWPEDGWYLFLIAAGAILFLLPEQVRR